MSEDRELYTTIATNGATHGPQPLTRLCALDRVFAATGIVEVKAGDRTIAIPIQAVDNESVEAVVAKYRPKAPVRSELQNGKRIIIENQADPDYQQKLLEYNRLTSYAYVFMAIAIDLVDAQGTVVWSADNTVHDFEAARQALRQTGIVDNQLATILTAAANLTRASEEAQVSD